jgi:hypothetical protein
VARPFRAPRVRIAGGRVDGQTGRSPPLTDPEGEMQMTKLPKFVVLGAGLIGVLAFFLPLLAVKDAGSQGKVSAFQIIKGLGKAQDVVDEVGKQAGMAAEQAGIEKQEVKRVTKDVDSTLGAIKAVVMAVFLPALLLLVFGAVGALRGAFGRVLGIFSLIFGLVGLGIWALLNAAAQEVSDSGAGAGIALHLLLLTGIGGAVGGLLATIKPERSFPRSGLG